MINDVELIKNSKFFDIEFYRKTNSNVTTENAITHYLKIGGFNGRNPSLYFDSDAYLVAYPDVVQSGLNPLVHFLRHGRREQRWKGVKPFFEKREQSKSSTEQEGFAAHQLIWHFLRKYLRKWNHRRLVQRHAKKRGNDLVVRNLGAPEHMLQIIRSELPELASIEPKLMTDTRFYEGLEQLPYMFIAQNTGAFQWLRVWRQIGRTAKHIVFVPSLIHGEANRAAIHLLCALQSRFGMDSVVMIATDHPGGSASSWLPDGTRFVCLNEQNNLMAPDIRREFVEKLIWALRPYSIFNVNSMACWDAFVTTGGALSSMTSLNALLFCDDYENSRRVGYANTHLRESVVHLSKVYFNTVHFMKELISRYGLPKSVSEKFRFVSQSYDDVLGEATPYTKAFSGVCFNSKSGDGVLNAVYVKSESKRVLKILEQLSINVDVSVILNVHREGLLLLPSLQSAQRCMRSARRAGISSELILVFDRCDMLTHEVFESFDFTDEKVRGIFVEFGDVGESRNAGVQEAVGKYIAFLDGDDLWCDSWLTQAFMQSALSDRESVFHPEFNIYFGHSQHIFQHIDMEDRFFDKSLLLFVNLWTSLCFVSRDFLRKCPYPRSDLENFIGYEDWGWNIRAISEGVIHKIVPDTFHAIRNKQVSLVRKTTEKKCFPPHPAELFW
jgi:hypothetical protein